MPRHSSYHNEVNKRHESTVVTMALISHDIGECIVYLPDYNLLFCTKHKSAIPLNELRNHLCLNSNHRLPVARWRLVFNAASTKDGLLQTLAELSVPKHGTDPIPILPMIQGMRCRRCNYLRGTRKHDGILKDHIIKNHVDDRHHWRDLAEEVDVQRWVADTRGIYWIVGSSGESEPSPLSTSKSPHDLVLDALAEDEDAELQEEEQRDREEDDAKSLDESTPWLKHLTKWPARFGDRPLSILAVTKRPPAYSANSRRNGVTAGTYQGVTVEWDSEFEERLHTIMTSLREMFDRCLATLDTTETQVACWIHSINDSYYPKEFKRCQRQSSEEKYFRSWKQLFSYLFRVHHFDESDRLQIYGRVYSEELAAQLTTAWELTGKIKHPSPPASLAEQLFDISISILTTAQLGGSYAKCTMMHFVGVLGIDEKTCFWKPPSVFTTLLAGLVWMSRLLFLEYALPERAYHNLISADASDNSRAEFPNPLGRLHFIRKKFVRRGTPYPLDAMLELLFRGNELRMREGGKIKVTWQSTKEVDDTLVLDTPKERLTLTMEDFHQTRVDAVLRVEEMVRRLMYGIEPDIDLDQIYDSLANWDVGYSFVKDRRNNLHKAFHALRAAATSAGPRSLMNTKFQYRVRRCERYLRDVDSLVASIFPAAQLSFGLPGRGTEMNIITWVNTREHVRNICVRYGTIVFMTDNSKLKGSTGKPFWVVRALPRCLARPLAAYLAYIRPFADSLHKILHPEQAERNSYLYRSYYSSRKHFSTTDGSLALYNATSTLSMPLKTGIYRQAAVAISKQHVENTVKVASPWDPSTMAEQISAWQCAHTVRTHRNSYARSSAMPTGLTEDLILQYVHNSIQWHRFGDLEKMVDLMRATRAKGKNSDREKRALAEIDSNLGAMKRRRIDEGEHCRRTSANGWDKKLAEYMESGYRCLDQLAGQAAKADRQESCQISLTSFITCMSFIEQLTSKENINRVMGLLRSARFAVSPDDSVLVPTEHLAARARSPDAFVTALLDVYNFQHLEYSQTHQNLLMTKALEQIKLSSGALDASDILISRQQQDLLLEVNPAEFGPWTTTHWHALTHNGLRWLTLMRHPRWGRSNTLGLSLLLPIDWKWNDDEHLAGLDMAAWAWFVDRIHLICPNLYRLACRLNDYGHAVMDNRSLPPLLEMEIQPMTDLNKLEAREVGRQLSLEAEEGKRVAKFYSQLVRPPPTWQRTVELAQQHT